MYISPLKTNVSTGQTWSSMSAREDEMERFQEMVTDILGDPNVITDSVKILSIGNRMLVIWATQNTITG